jgi:hypothetical protein
LRQAAPPASPKKGIANADYRTALDGRGNDAPGNMEDAGEGIGEMLLENKREKRSKLTGNEFL